MFIEISDLESNLHTVAASAIAAVSHETIPALDAAVCRIRLRGGHVILTRGEEYERLRERLRPCGA